MNMMKRKKIVVALLLLGCNDCSSSRIHSTPIGPADVLQLSESLLLITLPPSIHILVLSEQPIDLCYAPHTHAHIVVQMSLLFILCTATTRALF